MLEDQLARLQDEERAELSRNLDDEVGPLVFLAKIDFLALSRHGDIGTRARPRLPVALRVSDDQADLSVINKGLLTTRVETAGIGMQTMWERAAAVGGMLVVAAGDDSQGWHVRARLPLFETPETCVEAAK